MARVLSFLSRLFGQAPKPRSDAIPKVAPPPAPSAEALRVTSVATLKDGGELKRLAGLSGPVTGATVAGTTRSTGTTVTPDRGGARSAMERAAQARLAQLFDLGELQFSTVFPTPAEAAHLVVAAQSSRLRQTAAAAVDDPAQLRVLLKLARNKDKSVYKMLKQKCDVLDAEERRAAERTQEIELQCVALERHARRTYDPAYVSVLEFLERQWRTRDPRPADTWERRATHAIDTCREIVAGHLREIAAQAAEEAARDAVVQARQQASAASTAAAAAQAALDAQARADARTARDAEDAALAAQRAAQDQVYRQIGGLMRQARAALADGATQRAAGLRRTLDARIAAAPALPVFLTRQLDQLDAELLRLKQWKDYAVTPKRLELIEAMQALIGSTEPPQIVADNIKALQQAWRTTSKGIVGEAPDEWERFHQASQAAYAPCREYFAAQALLRQENLLARQTLLERVKVVETAQAESWDWHLAATVLREAPPEWRRYFPVERDANRPLQAEFEATLGRLQALLDGWWERNATDKSALVGQARQLLALEDSREAIEGVKQLQRRWKAVGAAARDREQTLWNEFREVCDAVYQRRQQAYVEYSAGLDANKRLAVALCQQVEGLAAAPDADMRDAEAQCAGCSAAFESLGEMPRADARALRTRFERGLAACQLRWQRQQARDDDAAMRNLFEAGSLLHAYRWSVSSAAPGSEQAARLHALDAHMAGVSQWPRNGLAALKAALAAVGPLPEVDAAAREQSLRMLCVRAELLSQTSTPPEDETLRREYQVQRLMQGMGQGHRAVQEGWDALILDWIRLGGAVAPALHAPLEARFRRAWSASAGGSGVAPH